MSSAEPSSPQGPPRRRFTWKSWVRQGLAAVAVLLAGQLAFVVFVAADDPWHAELRFRDYACDAPGPCRYRPNETHTARDGRGREWQFSTNGAGYRNPAFPGEARDPEAFRIEVFGGSPVFGLGVRDEETMSVRLAEELSRALPGRRFEVLNFGLPENFLLSQARAYAETGRRWSPDLVIFVQPQFASVHDMNDRLRQLLGSPLLQSMLGNRVGQALVNRYQYVSLDQLDRLRDERPGPLISRALEPLRDDQAQRGTRVLVFQMWGTRDGLEEVMPKGLQYGWAGTEMTKDEFLESPLELPEDGHPTADGHRYYAQLMAKEILPLLAPAPPPAP